MVAASKPASASRSRRRRAASSSAVPVSEWRSSSLSPAGCVGSSSARAAATSWSRTRSRSSWLAARPNVISSISSRRRRALGDVAGHQPGEGEGLARAGAGLEHGGGRPSGSGAEEVEGRIVGPASSHGPRSQRSSGSHTRAPARRAGWLALASSPGRGGAEQRGERRLLAPHPDVGGLGVLAGELAALPRLLARPPAGRRAWPGAGPRERRLERQRQRLAAGPRRRRRPGRAAARRAPRRRRAEQPLRRRGPRGGRPIVSAVQLWSGRPAASASSRIQDSSRCLPPSRE